MPASQRVQASNGLESFTAHADDADGQIVKLRAARAESPAFAFPKDQTLSLLSPEEAAARQVGEALESPLMPGFEKPALDGARQEFKSLGTERLALTGTTVVKFRQLVDKIPVYGSLVSAELDDANELVSLSSAVGTPRQVSPLANVSAAEAMKVALAAAGGAAPAGTVPRVHYYFDDGRWRLVYIVEDMPAKGDSRPNPLCDIIVDAHSGELVAQLPRTPGVDVIVTDGLGVQRQITVSEISAGTLGLRDHELNVHTYDFGYQDPDALAAQLPGTYVTVSDGAWAPMAVSAHANSISVVRFLREVLKRHNIDNKGGPLRSTINCVVHSESPGNKEWKNAYWNSVQMVYGQAMVEGSLRSLATSLDIVGHEVFHGVTERTARLEYARQPGALNESLSDIFGVILSNRPEPDYSRWNWEVGDGLGGEAFRNMSDPTLHGQPGHMDDFEVLPNTSAGDWGGVHTNSGIPNRAAYLLMTSKDPADGSYLFTPDDAAAVFYLALTQHLSRTSNFSQFRKAVDLSIKSLFRNQAPAYRQACVAAAAAAFDAVGIA